MFPHKRPADLTKDHKHHTDYAEKKRMIIEFLAPEMKGINIFDGILYHINQSKTPLSEGNLKAIQKIQHTMFHSADEIFQEISKEIDPDGSQASHKGKVLCNELALLCDLVIALGMTANKDGALCRSQDRSILIYSLLTGFLGIKSEDILLINLYPVSKYHPGLLLSPSCAVSHESKMVSLFQPLLPILRPIQHQMIIIGDNVVGIWRRQKEQSIKKLMSSLPEHTFLFDTLHLDVIDRNLASYLEGNIAVYRKQGDLQIDKTALESSRRMMTRLIEGHEQHSCSVNFSKEAADTLLSMEESVNDHYKERYHEKRIMWAESQQELTEYLKKIALIMDQLFDGLFVLKNNKGFDSLRKDVARHISNTIELIETEILKKKTRTFSTDICNQTAEAKRYYSSVMKSAVSCIDEMEYDTSSVDKIKTQYAQLEMIFYHIKEHLKPRESKNAEKKNDSRKSKEDMNQEKKEDIELRKKIDSLLSTLKTIPATFQLKNGEFDVIRAHNVSENSVIRSKIAKFKKHHVEIEHLHHTKIYKEYTNNIPFNIGRLKELCDKIEKIIGSINLEEAPWNDSSYDEVLEKARIYQSEASKPEIEPVVIEQKESIPVKTRKPKVKNHSSKDNQNPVEEAKVVEVEVKENKDEEPRRKTINSVMNRILKGVEENLKKEAENAEKAAERQKDEERKSSAVPQSLKNELAAPKSVVKDEDSSHTTTTSETKKSTVSIALKMKEAKEKQVKAEDEIAAEVHYPRAVMMGRLEKTYDRFYRSWKREDGAVISARMETLSRLQKLFAHDCYENAKLKRFVECLQTVESFIKQKKIVEDIRTNLPQDKFDAAYMMAKQNIKQDKYELIRMDRLEKTKRLFDSRKEGELISQDVFDISHSLFSRKYEEAQIFLDECGELLKLPTLFDIDAIEKKEKTALKIQNEITTLTKQIDDNLKIIEEKQKLKGQDHVVQTLQNIIQELERRQDERKKAIYALFSEIGRKIMTQYRPDTSEESRDFSYFCSYLQKYFTLDEIQIHIQKHAKELYSELDLSGYGFRLLCNIALEKFQFTNEGMPIFLLKNEVKASVVESKSSASVQQHASTPAHQHHSSSMPPFNDHQQTRSLPTHSHPVQNHQQTGMQPPYYVVQSPPGSFPNEYKRGKSTSQDHPVFHPNNSYTADPRRGDPRYESQPISESQFVQQPFYGPSAHPNHYPHAHPGFVSQPMPSHPPMFFPVPVMQQPNPRQGNQNPSPPGSTRRHPPRGQGHGSN